jgi:hypothetical protein
MGKTFAPAQPGYSRPRNNPVRYPIIVDLVHPG